MTKWNEEEYLRQYQQNEKDGLWNYKPKYKHFFYQPERELSCLAVGLGCCYLVMMQLLPSLEIFNAYLLVSALALGSAAVMFDFYRSEVYNPCNNTWS